MTRFMLYTKSISSGVAQNMKVAVSDIFMQPFECLFRQENVLLCIDLLKQFSNIFQFTIYRGKICP